MVRYIPFTPLFVIHSELILALALALAIPQSLQIGRNLQSCYSKKAKAKTFKKSLRNIQVLSANMAKRQKRFIHFSSRCSRHTRLLILTHISTSLQTFKQDPTIASDPTAFAGKEQILDRAVALHFIRQGQFQLGESFIKEAGMADDEEIGSSASEIKLKFKEMYDIMQELDKGSTESAIK